MKVRFCVRVSLVFLFALMMAASLPCAKGALAANPVTLRLYDPSGAFEVRQVFAPRLNDLNGKTICELSDGQWEDNRTFPVIRESLQRLFPTAKIIPYTEFPHESSGSASGGGFAIDLDSTANLVKQKGCQAAIVGNAG